MQLFFSIFLNFQYKKFYKQQRLCWMQRFFSMRDFCSSKEIFQTWEETYLCLEDLSFLHIWNLIHNAWAKNNQCPDSRYTAEVECLYTLPFINLSVDTLFQILFKSWSFKQVLCTNSIKLKLIFYYWRV